MLNSLKHAAKFVLVRLHLGVSVSFLLFFLFSFFFFPWFSFVYFLLSITYGMGLGYLFPRGVTESVLSILWDLQTGRLASSSGLHRFRFVFLLLLSHLLGTVYK